MKIILKEAVENLGESGDVVNVKPGFARNFLIPQGLGYRASEANLRRVEQELSEGPGLVLTRHLSLPAGDNLPWASYRSPAARAGSLQIGRPVMRNRSRPVRRMMGIQRGSCPGEAGSL